MFSLWRPLRLHATTTRCQISRVPHFKDGLVSFWALHQDFKLQVTIQQRHSSHLVKHVRHEGFRIHGGILIKPGDTVELEDGNFVRVKEVVHNEYQNRYWILGWSFVRNVKTHGLPNHPNEVYWVVHLEKNNHRPAAEQALVLANGSQILRKRPWSIRPMQVTKRWKHVIVTKTGKRDRPLDAFHIHAAKIAEASFQSLRAEECDHGHNNQTADETLRRSWRGLTKRGGACIKSKEPNSLPLAIEALSLEDSDRKESGPTAYTFADVCCGAGGASHGAKLAGLRLCWALDHDAAACRTFRLNFPEVRLYHKPIKDIIRLGREGLIVDILHLSPPCQAFSKANRTTNLKNDKLNITTNMEVGNCLYTARPRIVTVEQTDNLMSEGHVGGKHSEHWGKVIEQFTSRGYSVAWKVMNLAELGLPQPRKRLIMIASCPGEALPHFPEPTHAKDPGKTGLKLFASVKDAISIIPPNYPKHIIIKPLKRPHKPYNENRLLPDVVTTGRSTNAHPSGLRTFSLRELACLQGFRLEFRFPENARNTDTMKQIGNAFPSTVAAVLYEWIKQQLLLRDGFKPHSLAEEGMEDAKAGLLQLVGTATVHSRR